MPLTEGHFLLGAVLAGSAVLVDSVALVALAALVESVALVDSVALGDSDSFFSVDEEEPDGSVAPDEDPFRA
jgi:hypothetical protein